MIKRTLIGATLALAAWINSSPATPPPPHLVKDLFTHASRDGSYPSAFCEFQGQLYFCAFDNVRGTGLWKSDGTLAGTTKVKDLPGGGFTPIQELLATEDALYFAAEDPAAGLELWKSDGTEAGTARLKDLWPGLDASNPRSFSNVGNTVFFQANDSQGSALWKTDGTIAGTQLLKRIIVGTGPTLKSSFAVLNGLLIFRGGTSVDDLELWKSDGTEAGTQLVKDLRVSSGGAPGNFAVFQNEVYFVADDGISGLELWKTDGTSQGTVGLGDINPGPAHGARGPLVATSHSLFFEAMSPSTGLELWKTDGTVQGTVLVKDIYPGITSSDVEQQTVLGDEIFFRANDGQSGVELWKSDGTAAGTVLVADINPLIGAHNTPRDSYPASFAAGENLIYFVADDGTNDRDLWITDGTSSGTRRVADLPDGDYGYFVEGAYLVIDDVLYLRRIDYYGAELWKSDGTESGTTMVKDIAGSNGSSNAELLTPFGNSLLFVAAVDDTTARNALWISDGTAAGTQLLKVLEAPWYPVRLTTIKAVGSQAYYILGGQLWKTDGTPAGTTLLKDSGVDYGLIGNEIAAIGNTIYFAAQDSTHGLALWKSNGTTSGTVMLKDIDDGGMSPTHPRQFTPLGNLLLFYADDQEHGVELWKTDGTEAGTTLVKDIHPTGDSWPQGLKVLNGQVYFSATHPQYGTELWKSDGTSAGTVLVKDIFPGGSETPGASSEPQGLTLLNGKLYFHVMTTELWETDGTAAGTLPVAPTFPNTRQTTPLVATSDALYCVRSNGAQLELWATSGTAASVRKIKDLGIGTLPERGLGAVAYGNLLFFSAPDDTQGTELWVTDGTEAGTRLYADLNGDDASSYPNELTMVGTQLYLTALREDIGRELFRIGSPHPPTLELAGDNPLTFEAAASYLDAGAMANDAEDGLLLPTIVANTVISNVPGDYTVTWQAVDSGGNTATATRTVHVVDTTAPRVNRAQFFFLYAEEGTETVSLPDLFGSLGASDVVGITAHVQEPAPGTLLPIGLHDLSFTLSDAAGNTATVPAIMKVFHVRAANPLVTLQTLTGLDSLAPGAGTAGGPPAGSILSALFAPAIDDFRNVAAKATLKDGRTLLSAIYQRDEAGVAQLRAFQNQAVPLLSGATFRSFGEPLLAGNGSIAFAAKLQGKNVVTTSTDDTIWTDALDGGLRQVLREGSEVLSGLKLKAVSSFALRDNELLALATLQTAKGSVTSSDDTVVLRITDAGPEILLREGTAIIAGNRPAASKIKTISLLGPALGSPGHGRWQADGATVAKATLADGRTVVLRLVSGVEPAPILVTQMPAEALELTAKWTKFGLPAIGTSGVGYAVHGSLQSLRGEVTSADDTALLFSEDGETFRELIRENAPAFDAEGSPVFASFLDPVVNAEGEALFQGTLRGTGTTTKNKIGLWRGTPGNLELAVRLGDLATDADGAEVTGRTWTAFVSHALPDGRGPLFLAKIAGPGINSTNNLGLWSQSADGQIREIIRTGAEIPMSDDDIHEVRQIKTLTLLTSPAGVFGATRSFNATGSVAVLATFTDNTQAILRLDLP